MSKRGFFITIEGPDGSGKSTQIAQLVEHLEEKGLECLCTREPGGTEISEKIRSLILDRKNKGMAAMTEALLYAASRAQLAEEVIKPALAAGKVVVCDRFVDSSIAYQGYGRGLGDTVKAINVYATAALSPDLTFLMKLDPEVGRGRIDESAADRIESETSEFHRKVYEGYLRLEESEKERIAGIDASRSVEDISAELISVLDERLKKSGII